MKTLGYLINIKKEIGVFVENKDMARIWRQTKIFPALKVGLDVTLNFEGVEFVTQSFVHALISAALREYGEVALKKLIFKSCNKPVKQIVLTVIEYSLDKAA
ncbi:MAG: STAS-like domain-containing protein [Candidatus Omnitrophica bacterium]|nr:STAS-like domain-containing protein [Candidatus Omnitrophota bacterium]MBU4302868.1 STAS-like domain-containing protein [Candidatus Omnitrophota bacterium]MBU4419015.1 STAS-like domain-containing protein [Candidatus Omnitrophota bacterium]MBU4468738.1 STAS-like domain-containing protein [Candidatus Omnitrophota bacterium]MCG2708230.1 STAS-like domain-containing protein [Candidatus Omnitrophota bacterium]